MFRLDVNNMMAYILGAKDGITKEKIEAVKDRVSWAHNQIRERRERGDMGFTELPYQTDTVERIDQTAEKISKTWENFVLLGIGGSA